MGVQILVCRLMILIGSDIFVVKSQSASELGVRLRVRGKLSPVAILVAGCEENHCGCFSSFHVS